MATEPEEVDVHHEEEEGGPTKTFLEHLEDLRWMLMKCAAVIGVGFLVCLFASPVIVKVLTWPLKRAQIHAPGKNPTLTFLLGTNHWGPLTLDTNQAKLFGTNHHITLEIAPVQIDTNLVLALKPSTNQGPGLWNEQGVNLVNLGPATAFFLAVEMAIYAAIALGSPFLLYFIGQFVFPALKMNEKKYTYIGLGFGTFLFLTGVAFCYFVLMPVALKASVQYSEWMGFSVYDWRAEDYIRFVSKFLLGMGLGFELPVVILVLVKIGLVTYRQLAAFRRYMIVINLILGAVLTTPEVITQVLMAIPLQLLYEVSVWIAWYWERQEKKRRGTIELSE
jgi:sec-independent protein translocase protein TatC